MMPWFGRQKWFTQSSLDSILTFWNSNELQQNFRHLKCSTAVQCSLGDAIPEGIFSECNKDFMGGILIASIPSLLAGDMEKASNQGECCFSKAAAALDHRRELICVCGLHPTVCIGKQNATGSISFLGRNCRARNMLTCTVLSRSPYVPPNSLFDAAGSNNQVRHTRYDGRVIFSCLTD